MSPVDDMYNVPLVTDVTQVLQQWVYSGNNTANRQRLLNAPERDLPELVRRFMQDTYMCIYINADGEEEVAHAPSGEEETPHTQPPSASLPTDRHQPPTDQPSNSFYTSKPIDAQHHTLTAGTVATDGPSSRPMIVTQPSITDQMANLQLSYDNLKKEYDQYKAKMTAELSRLKQENENLRRGSNWKIRYMDMRHTDEEVGKGAYGTIKVAWYCEQKVAVKQMHNLIMSTEMVDKMSREIDTMSKLRHPNLLLFIAAVLDHPSGHPMIVTELMEMSLRDANVKKLLKSDREKLAIMRDAAAGLNYLHCLPDPIIHRDVSSANVLLESKGPGQWKTKIGDFGSANLAHDAVTANPGALVYCAPEATQSVARSESDCIVQTPKMDVFSFGVLLCEVMTCQFPSQASFPSMLKQITIPLVYKIVHNCVDKDPDKRPSMTSIIQDINSYID